MSRSAVQQVVRGIIEVLSQIRPRVSWTMIAVGAALVLPSLAFRQQLTVYRLTEETITSVEATSPELDNLLSPLNAQSKLGLSSFVEAIRSALGTDVSAGGTSLAERYTDLLVTVSSKTELWLGFAGFGGLVLLLGVQTLIVRSSEERARERKPTVRFEDNFERRRRLHETADAERFTENLKAHRVITQIELKDHPFYESIHWELCPHVNVLLGRNGYGKSLLAAWPDQPAAG